MIKAHFIIWILNQFIQKERLGAVWPSEGVSCMSGCVHAVIGRDESGCSLCQDVEVLEDDCYKKTVKRGLA